MRWLEDLEDMLVTFANHADGPESPEASNAGILAEAIRRTKQLLAEVERLKAEAITVKADVVLYGGRAQRLVIERDRLRERAKRLQSNRQGLRFVTRARRFQVVELKAEVARLRERAERAERERDRLLDAYIHVGTREDVRRFFGLDAAPAGEEPPP